MQKISAKYPQKKYTTTSNTTTSTTTTTTTTRQRQYRVSRTLVVLLLLTCLAFFKSSTSGTCEAAGRTTTTTTTTTTITTITTTTTTTTRTRKLPPAATKSTASSEKRQLQDTSTDIGTSVTDILPLYDDASVLLEKLEATGLLTVLNGEGPFTLLVPLNAAFQEGDVYPERLDTEEFRPHLIDLISYHVLDGVYPSSSFIQNEPMETLSSGRDNTVEITSFNPPQFNNDALATTLDLITDNGLVHFIDKLLLPSSLTEEAVSRIITTPELSTLLALVQVLPDLLDILQTQTVTLFAPTDSAFAASSSSDIQALTDPENSDQLNDILSYHVAPGVIVSSQLQDGMTITMLNGKTATIYITPNPQINQASIIEADLLVKNGVIHIIDAVLVPDENATPAPTLPVTSTPQPTLSPTTIEPTMLPTNEPTLTPTNAATTIQPTDSPTTIEVTEEPTTATILTQTEMPTPMEDEDDDDDDNVLYENVWQAIDDPIFESTLTFFARLLQQVNLDKLLQDLNMTYTVFAPSNEAIQSNALVSAYVASIDAWVGHLSHVLQQHIVYDVNGVVWTREKLWSGEGEESLMSLTDSEITVDQENQRIGGQAILEENSLAVNGIVHKAEGTFTSSWTGKSIFDIMRKASGNFSVFDIWEDLIKENVNTGELGSEGATIVVPTDASATVLLPTNIVSDRLLLYHTIPKNIYINSQIPGSYSLIETKATSNILVTVEESGELRYNGVSVLDESLAENGVVHQIQEVLTEPGTLEMVQLFENFAGLSLSVLLNLFRASDLRTDDVSTILGERVNLLVPVDSNFELYMPDVERRLEPAWILHLEQLLFDLMIPESNVIEQTMQSYLGTTYSVSESPQLTIGTGKIINPSTVAKDGDLFILDNFTLPASLSSSLGDIVAGNPTEEFARYVIVSEIVIDDGSTVFAPLDTAFVGAKSKLVNNSLEEVENFVNCHIFPGNLYSDVLLEMDGEVITSLNGTEWLVEVLPGESVLLSSQQGDTIAAVVDTDNLFRNGVVHFVDSLFSSNGAYFSTAAPSTQVTGTASPSQTPSDSPISTESCSVCDDGLDPNSEIPGGIVCSDWFFRVSLLEADSQACLIERAIGMKYCECYASETPQRVCGNFCPRYTVLQESLVPQGETRYNCKELSEVVIYLSDESVCASVKESSERCCEIPSFGVNISFVVFNQANLKAEDFALPENARIMRTSFLVFVEELVSQREGSRRNLQATSTSLRPDSGTITGVAPMSGCPLVDDIPFDASCLTVYGYYELLIQSDSPQAVVEAYITATADSIADGVLQSKLDETNSSYPFRISSDASNHDGNSSNLNRASSGSNDGMEWWVMLCIVLGCVCGVAGCCCIGAYFAGRRKGKSASDREHSTVRDVEGAPMAGVSVPLLGNETDESSRSLDHAKVRSMVDQSHEFEVASVFPDKSFDIENPDVWEDGVESWKDEEEQKLDPVAIIESESGEIEGSWDDNKGDLRDEYSAEFDAWEDPDERETSKLGQRADTFQDELKKEDIDMAESEEQWNESEENSFVADEHVFEAAPASVVDDHDAGNKAVLESAEWKDESRKDAPTGTDVLMADVSLIPNDEEDEFFETRSSENLLESVDDDESVVKLQQGLEELQKELAGLQEGSERFLNEIDRSQKEQAVDDSVLTHSIDEDEEDMDDKYSVPAPLELPVHNDEAKPAPLKTPDGKTATWFSIADALEGGNNREDALAGLKKDADEVSLE